tara:strand:+ start:3084 stop:3353 length:270 start_codon:yes stop_codon:yes gene_type:complete
MEDRFVYDGLMVLINETMKHMVTTATISKQLVIARRSNTTGRVVGVTGYPGEMLWVVRHHLDESEAIYNSDEFEPDEVAIVIAQPNPSL